MSIILTIPDELAGRLETFAKTRATTPAQVALAAIERELSAIDRLDEVLAPVRAAFEASGMTEDEAAALFEAEKHAMRRERRAGAP